MTPTNDSTRLRRRRERRIWLSVFAFGVVLSLATLIGIYGSSIRAYLEYSPKEGDIVFQSLPRSPLVNAIEGATHSPYSHCGIVAKRNGHWVVYEAYQGVEATPIREFLFRGRGQGFAVYRFKPDYQRDIPATIENVQTFLGRPYDARYRMDNERIYCSELIYKAYRNSTGRPLGELVRFGDLNWKPFQAIVKRYEGGPAPIERRMITPRDLALAPEIELVFHHNIATPLP